MDTDKPKARTGRREKWSPALSRKITRLISSGLTIAQSCIAAGVSESTVRKWRNERPHFTMQFEAAREQLRARVLAQMRRVGKDDWRCLAEFARLTFTDLRNNGANVSVAVQAVTTLSDRDPERALLIARREAALANAAASSPPLQLDDSIDARAIAEETEARLKQAVDVEPEPERPPRSAVDKAAWAEQQRRDWSAAARAQRDDLDDVLYD